MGRIEKVLSDKWKTAEQLRIESGYSHIKSVHDGIYSMGSAVEKKYEGKKRSGYYCYYRLRQISPDYKVNLKTHWPCNIKKSEWHQCFHKMKCHCWREGRCLI